MTREVKFRQILNELLESSPYTKTRKHVCEIVGISQSRLTQFLRDESQKPSLETLIELADFFHVSLDYIIFGEDKEPTEVRAFSQDPTSVTLTRILAGLQERSDSHTWMVGLITQALVQQIDKVADELVSEGKNSQPGMIGIEAIEVIEQCSLVCYILSTNLHHDLIRSDTGEFLSGRFTPIVAANLSRGCRYRFVVPIHGEKTYPYWEESVASYRRILMENYQLDHRFLSRCEFKATRMPVIAGCALYKLDLTKLKQTDTVLAHRLSPGCSVDGWVGCVISPSEHIHADSLIDLEHLWYIKSNFDLMWNKGEYIPRGRSSRP